MSQIKLPAWAFELFKPYRYKVVYGGRASGKGWAYAIVLLAIAAQSRKRIGVAREYQKSTKYSAYELLCDRAADTGILGYRSTRDEIRHANGSVFQFRGLSKVQEEAIKGWENVDIVWVEEADVMSQRSWELLRNTIRKPGSELWLTFNPKNRYDPVYEYFILNTPERMFRRKVLYTDNPFFSQESEWGRLNDLKTDPARYPHIWLGEPDDSSDKPLVLPYDKIMSARNAWSSKLAGKYEHAGFDVADTGDDYCALAVRAGPVLKHLELWKASNITESVQRVHHALEERGVVRLYYDVGGIGRAVTECLRHIGKNRGYSIHPVTFGGSPTRPDKKYTKRLTNSQYFSNRAAQLGWNVRNRAENTQRIDAGEGVPARKGLYIDPSIDEKVLYQLSQPTWNSDNKLKITKKGPGQSSPDAYDAVIMSFARDTERL